MSVTINHIALNCRDIRAQEAFYARHFGFRRSRTFRKGEPSEFIMIKLGTVRLELFPTQGQLDKEHGGSSPSGSNTWRFRCRV